MSSKVELRSISATVCWVVFIMSCSCSCLQSILFDISIRKYTAKASRMIITHLKILSSMWRRLFWVIHVGKHSFYLVFERELDIKYFQMIWYTWGFCQGKEHYCSVVKSKTSVSFCKSKVDSPTGKYNDSVWCHLDSEFFEQKSLVELSFCCRVCHPHYPIQYDEYR